MGAFHVFINFDDGSQIATSVAIVGSREDGCDMAVVGMLISVVHKLMSPCDLLQAVCMVKFHRVILNKTVLTCPKVHPAPLGLTLKPKRSSGSLHSKSQIGPSLGTYWILSSFRISSSVLIFGERPPWVPKICP